jgi:hypothetical protein
VMALAGRSGLAEREGSSHEQWLSGSYDSSQEEMALLGEVAGPGERAVAMKSAFLGAMSPTGRDGSAGSGGTLRRGGTASRCGLARRDDSNLVRWLC